MFLEFCGPAGAGKSTLERLLLSHLAELGVEVRSRENLIADFIRARLFPLYVDKAPWKWPFRWLYKSTCYGGHLRRRWRSGYWPNLFPFCARKKGLRPMRLHEDLELMAFGAGKGIFNFSESIVQRLTSAHRDVPDKAEVLQRFLDAGRQAVPETAQRLIIRLDAPHELAQERRLKRDFPDASPEELARLRKPRQLGYDSRAWALEKALSIGRVNVIDVQVDQKTDWVAVVPELARRTAALVRDGKAAGGLWNSGNLFE